MKSEEEYVNYLNQCALNAAKRMEEKLSTPEGRREWEMEMMILERRAIISSGESARRERMAAWELRDRRYVG